MNETAFEKMMEWYKINGLVPRQSQIDVAKMLASNWDKKYQIVDAPTGIGKSFIALAAGHAAGKSYLLTHTKQLQDQYLDGPGAITDLRGRGNYKCKINPLMTAADAPCIQFEHIKFQCAGRRICPYIEQKKRALAAQNMMTNYAYFVLSNECGPIADADERDLLICDEAHILEGLLIGAAEFVLDPKELKEEHGVYDLNWTFVGDNKDNLEIISSIKARLISEHARYHTRIKDIYHELGLDQETITTRDIENLPDKVKKKVKELSTKADKLDKILKKIYIYERTKDENEWVVSENEGALKLTPLHAKFLFTEYMEREATAKKYMFMSATIGAFDAFIEEIGIPKEDCNFISCESVFDKEASPIIHISVGKFSYDRLKDTLPIAMQVIDKLLQEHPKDKGIIHSTNYNITKYVADNSLFKARLLHRNMKKFGVKNQDLFEQHRDSKQPTVLLSPSMNTGISLEDDLARFQIIIKLPFMSLGDKRTKMKMTENNLWYRNHMWREIMQSSGRATRSEDDYSITYILDESLLYFFKMDKGRLPEWFKERIIF